MLMVPVSLNKPITECTALALDTFLNLAGTIDMGGKRKLFGDLWLEDTSESKIKDSMKMLLSSQMSNISTPEYFNTVRCLFPVLARGVHSADRETVLRYVDLLGKLASNADNAVVLNRCPDGLFRTLVSLLCVTNTVGEAILPANADLNYSDTDYRPQMSSGSFFELADTEVRDTALDTLLSIVTASTEILRRISSIPKLFRILRLLVDSSREKTKTDGPQKASALLVALASAPAVVNNSSKFLSIQADLSVLACSDEYITGIPIYTHYITIITIM